MMDGLITDKNNGIWNQLSQRVHEVGYQTALGLQAHAIYTLFSISAKRAWWLQCWQSTRSQVPVGKVILVKSNLSHRKKCLPETYRGLWVPPFPNGISAASHHTDV